MADRRSEKRMLRRILDGELPPDVRQHLIDWAKYEGHAHHKRDAKAWGLESVGHPPREKTKCDDAGFQPPGAEVPRLLEFAKRHGLASVAMKEDGDRRLPAHLWIVDEQGRAIEFKYGSNGRYHGYPLMETNDRAQMELVLRAWNGREKAPVTTEFGK